MPNFVEARSGSNNLDNNLILKDGPQVVEPQTFAERAVFLKRMNRNYLEGRIPWNALWYYEQRYGFGRS
jgi:hypothetical protein